MIGIVPTASLVQTIRVFKLQSIDYKLYYDLLMSSFIMINNFISAPAKVPQVKHDPCKENRRKLFRVVSDSPESTDKNKLSPAKITHLTTRLLSCKLCKSLQAFDCPRSRPLACILAHAGGTVQILRLEEQGHSLELVSIYRF